MCHTPDERGGTYPPPYAGDIMMRGNYAPRIVMTM